ncbi:anthrone oxygenase family protein [Sphaerisporangium sp. NPDC049002]|uniref:anthrone oxygenase family protein n=1 Tax=Sphaerisporangium sp. NPDC049002 TaxID=3155392 RepID=UPI0033CDBCBA
MTDLARGATLVTATIITGLVADLFYAYAISVMLGLNRTDDRTFVSAMRSINVAILNGWFLLAFLGAPVLTALAAVLALRAGTGAALLWIVAALALYAVVLIVTFVVNVPLNDQLEAAGSDHALSLAAVRGRFEARWVRWNVVRAVASTAAFGCLTWALVLFGQNSTSV